MNRSSVWKAQASATNFSALNDDIEADVAIVGGGITGITAAYLLAKGGKKVAVLEANAIGEGATGYSTGNLYSMVGNQGLHNIVSKFDEKTARDVVHSRKAAVDLIEETVKAYHIACDFKRVPWCLFSNSDENQSFIKDEKEAALNAGLTVSPDIDVPLPYKYGFKIDDQAQFNPLQYVVSLAKKINGGGCRIFEDTKVIDIDDGENKCVLSTPNGKVTASKVILATHTPVGIYSVHLALGPYREYAVAVKLKGGYPESGIFWDVQKSEHYSLRTYETSGNKVLMALGEVHKVGQKTENDDCYENLEKFLRKHFDVSSVSYKWSAQQYRPADSLPYIGRVDDDSALYYATGFSADGLTYGTLSAMILADEILGKKNKWADTYRLSRFTPIASAKDFVKENLNVAAQYMKDIPYKAEVEKLSEIGKGEGKTIEIDGEKFGAYRDPDGKMHLVSAVCTHMKCIVNWNKEETSWDCPCHGSRFTYDGKVIEGPAISDLPKMAEKIN